ncbi:MAG: hypothetical protein ACTHN0_10815 [Aquihabitans sp.]
MGALALVVVPLALGRRAVDRGLVLIMPDLWETALAVDSAGRGGQLVGAWSRLGLYHPGPLWFYWAAPFFAWAGGQPSGLFLAALALLAVGGPVIIVLVGREAGAAAAGVGAVVLLAGVHRLGLAGLSFPWNPTVLIVPAAVGLVAAAVAWHRPAAGATAIGVVAASFVAQAHLGALLLGALIGVASLLGAFRHRRGFARPGLVLGAVAALVVGLWAPVLVDQAAGVGNLGATVRYAATGDVSPRFPPSPTGRSLSLSPVGSVAHVASVGSLTDGDTASWAGAEFQRGLEHRPSQTSVVVVAGLVAVALAAAWTNRSARDRGSRFLGSLSALALLALVLQVVAAVRIRHEFRPYLIAGTASVGWVLWLVAGLVGLQQLRRRWPIERPDVAVVAATVGSIVVLLIAASPPFERFIGFPSEVEHQSSAVAGIARLHLRPGVLLRADDEPAFNAQQRFTLALEHAGVRVAVRGRYASRFSDRQRRARPGRQVFWLAEGVGPPPHCQVIGTFEDGSVCLMPEGTSA